MKKSYMVGLLLIGFLAACEPDTQTNPAEQAPASAPTSAQGTPQQADEDPQVADTAETPRLVPRIFWINAHERQQIPTRILDAINGLRGTKELPAVTLSSELNAAARTHSRDMSVQNRPWHFGSDGSSPLSRTARAGFAGQLLGENISETFEGDLATLAAWMDDPVTRKLILNPKAGTIGIGWYQESRGKIWWTLVVGT
ncbi:MAG: CAP domain-containing protein [Rhodobacteraceae bacterium]|nr:CAP domain-containing protein [Paracoccaceae bacterium]MCY4196052.1 CAP domain-containing protein [Paracoccaceae bacterium]MCY4328425.1 CAP domain-containing protein [Paracoccaceae bacterium]